MTDIDSADLPHSHPHTPKNDSKMVKIMSGIIVLMLVAAVPITISELGKEQDTRQDASLRDKFRRIPQVDVNYVTQTPQQPITLEQAPVVISQVQSQINSALQIYNENMEALDNINPQRDNQGL